MSDGISHYASILPLSPVAANGLIAIVDDDSELCNALALWLDVSGRQAVRFGSGEDLLEHLYFLERGAFITLDSSQIQRLPLKGAILDLNLPGINGSHLAAALRSNAPGLPIVMITALSPNDRLRYGSPPTGIRCLKKPFELDELASALFDAVTN